MFHRCKFGLNEYRRRKDDLFTVLETLVTMDFYHLVFLIWSHNSVVHMLSCFQNVASTLVGCWRQGSAYHSQLQRANSQRNVFHGKCLFINLKDMIVILEAVRDVAWNKSKRVVFNYFLVYVYEYSCHWLWEIWWTWDVCFIAKERKPMITAISYLVMVKLNCCVVIHLVKDSVEWTG